MKFRVRSEKLLDGTYVYNVLKKSWLGYSTIKSFPTLAEANDYVRDNS